MNNLESIAKLIRYFSLIMTTEAGDPARVHDAGREVVALHPVLVPCAIRKMCERCLAEFVLFQFPEVL